MGLLNRFKKKQPEPTQQAGEIHIRLPRAIPPPQPKPKLRIPLLKKDGNQPVEERQDIIKPLVIGSDRELESVAKTGLFREKERTKFEEIK